MTAFNVVRMRVKPGFVDEFLKFHREEDLGAMPGMKRMTVVEPASGTSASSANGPGWTRWPRRARRWSQRSIPSGRSSRISAAGSA